MSYIHNNTIHLKMATLKITNIRPTQRPMILSRGQLREDVQKIMTKEWKKNIECFTNFCPHHSISQASFITCAASICTGIYCPFFPAVQLPLFHRINVEASTSHFKAGLTHSKNISWHTTESLTCNTDGYPPNNAIQLFQRMQIVPNFLRIMEQN
jgi:hypothetical protein